MEADKLNYRLATLPWESKKWFFNNIQQKNYYNQFLFTDLFKKLTTVHSGDTAINTTDSIQLNSASVARVWRYRNLIITIITTNTVCTYAGTLPSLPRHCWLGDRKGIRPVKCWVLNSCCW